MSTAEAAGVAILSLVSELWDVAVAVLSSPSTLFWLLVLGFAINKWVTRTRKGVERIEHNMVALKAKIEALQSALDELGAGPPPHCKYEKPLSPEERARVDAMLASLLRPPNAASDRRHGGLDPNVRILRSSKEP
jgi:hypothetical protein